MTFSEAIEAMKNGECVAREGWNGKGMWVAITPGSVLHRHPATADAPTGWEGRLTGAASVIGAVENPDTIRIAPHIDMRAADGTLVVGWLASQTDMLATDWTIKKF